jgi:uncharacterized protein
MDVEETLSQETMKWLDRLESAYSSFSPTGKLPEKDLKPIRENVEAYIKDAKFFMEKGDLVRAFEAVIYAWGLLEACQHMGLIGPEGK